MTSITRSTDGSRAMRGSTRYSVTAAYLSMSAAEQDTEVEDELAQAQKQLQDLKSRISSQSKKNFVLERDVRYLDSRIALLIQNRMALNEHNALTIQLDEAAEVAEGHFPDDRKQQLYGNLFFLLQSEPRYIAALCRLVTLTEIDTLLQTVMFTIYGNQYERREENLLLSMFQSVLSSQFDNTPEFTSLLRANTPVSRMMTTYTRRGPGQGYLKSVLANRINWLIEERDLELETNPIKVYERLVHAKSSNAAVDKVPISMVPMEVASADQEVIATIEPRIAKLAEITQTFLEPIITQVHLVPYGIRWICKQIRNLTRRKYPDVEDRAICSLIGGFFFLRFINPAIVTPQAYMLVEASPTELPRRSLTLIAKVLQSLANKPSYSKEPHMASLIPYIEANQTRVNKFILDLCEVGDFYESLEMDQYIALSKKDLHLSITINEVYSTHALLEKYLQSLAPNEDSHLKFILNELGPAPALLPRVDNGSIELPLFSRFETGIKDLGDSLDLTQADVLYMETKALLVQILRTCPPNCVGVKPPLWLKYVADKAAQSKDATSVRRGIKALDMLRELSQKGLVDEGDNLNPLTEEVEEELAHLGSLREKVVSECQSLESVYRTIRDHNDYLRGQLETYKSYLQNVRVQSTAQGGGTDGVGLVSVGGKQKKQNRSQPLGPVRYTHQQLEREGVIVESSVPENCKANIYFTIASPTPGTFVISLHYKGRSKSLLELDLKLDDLLEMQQNHIEFLDLEYVQFNASRILHLLNRQFSRRR